MSRFASRKSVALVFGVAAAFYCAAMAIRLHTQWYDLDFSHYYCWALALRTGIDPYTADLVPMAARLGLKTGAFRANYPPTFLLCFEPLTLLRPEVAYWIWTGFNFILLLASLATLFAGSGIGELEMVVLVALGIYYEPVSENFFWAQAQIILLLLLALNFRWARAGRDMAAGLALAAAVLLKAFPLILLLHFALARRTRVVVWTLVGIAAGGIITLLILGPVAFEFLHPGTTTSDMWWKSGLAVSASITRIFFAVFGVPLSLGANLARIALISAAVIWCMGLGTRATIVSSRRGRNDAAYGLWVVLTVFIFPISWIHHMVLLLLLFAQVVLDAHEGNASGSVPTLAIGSYAVAEIALPLFWIYWLTWYIPLLPVSAAIAQVSGVLAFWAAYRLAIPSRSLAREPADCGPQKLNDSQAARSKRLYSW